MKLHHRLVSPCLVWLTLTAFSWASLLPGPLGPRSALAFTVGEEREVGEKLLSLVRKEFTLLDDLDLTEYLSALGRQTLEMAGVQYFDYHFFVIDNREFNAFAAPSGLIFFHSGLIELCATEGELVSVLAHEIGHATSRHIADRLDKSAKINAGAAALMLAGLLVGAGGGGGAISQALVTGSMAGGVAAQLKFSREDEEEADRLAFKWMKAQDRDPAEMIGMLAKMRRASRYHRTKVPTYLLTHPEPENRIGYIEDMILQDAAGQYPPHDDFAYLRFKHRVQALSRETASIVPILEAKAAKPGAFAAEPMLFYGLSQAYLANREYQKAEEALQKVLSRMPEKTILKTDLGRIRLEAGALAEALALFREVHRLTPNDGYNTFFLAKALQQTGASSEAVLLYESLSARFPSYAKLYLEIGRLRAALGNQAMGHYNLALHAYYEGAIPTARYHLEQALKNISGQDSLTEKVLALKSRIARLEKI